MCAAARRFTDLTLLTPPRPQYNPGAEGFYKVNDLAVLAQIVLPPGQEAGELLKHTQYLRAFGERKLTGAALVAALDYEDVVKYLRGETATANQVRLWMGLLMVVGAGGGLLCGMNGV